MDKDQVSMLKASWNELLDNLVDSDVYQNIEELAEIVESMLKHVKPTQPEMQVFFIYDKVQVEGDFYDFSVVCAPNSMDALKIHCDNASEKKELTIEHIDTSTSSEARLIVGQFLQRGRSNISIGVGL